MQKPIRILSADMDILGETEAYESMFFTRRFHTFGDNELQINRYKKHADKLLKGNLILVGKDLNKVFIIKHREIELDEQGKATENWIIRGLSLQSVVAQRITIPPAYTAYDYKSGNAETVMKHYIERNIVNPVDPRRKIPQLVIAPNKNRGPSISWQSRYKNLAEEMTEISLATGLGWDVILDLKNKQWVFDVVEGKDVSVNQSVHPPVIFSPQFESLQSLHYTESELNYKNSAYVAGQGEGVERRIVEVGKEVGLSRHEIFIDARDIPETEDIEVPDGDGGTTNETIPRPVADIIKDLTDRGNQQLEQLIQEHYLEGQILTYSPFKYEKDYNLGDITTIQSKDWGVTLDTRITEIKEIYEENGFRIEGTFGNNRPTLTQKIKQELAQMSGEVRK
ncbi:siphovirus ReqiPepy6 Gp37-like family protein [Heyndrickxia sp. FSL W8-0496]|uniref:siphovirus ReqiPepy6 Gp37-like family protein n=1 Tax=Heyndrickxia sp. FSL W8-0496 TaxID=2954702 RepID=UPI0030F95CAF